MTKLLATYTRDGGGLHCEMKDIETQEVVHTITVAHFSEAWMTRFVKEVKSWAARNDALIVEEAAGGDEAWRGDACHE